MSLEKVDKMKIVKNAVGRMPRSDVVARTQVVLVIGCSTSDLDT